MSSAFPFLLVPDVLGCGCVLSLWGLGLPLVFWLSFESLELKDFTFSDNSLAFLAEDWRTSTLDFLSRFPDKNGGMNFLFGLLTTALVMVLDWKKSPTVELELLSFSAVVISFCDSFSGPFVVVLAVLDVISSFNWMMVLSWWVLFLSWWVLFLSWWVLYLSWWVLFMIYNWWSNLRISYNFIVERMDACFTKSWNQILCR